MDTSLYKIAYITSISFPSTLANRINTLSTAEALTNVGHEVVLIGNNIKISGEYDIPRVYNTKTKKLVSIVKSFLALHKKECFKIWLVREPRLLLMLILLGTLSRNKVPILYEVHDAPRDVFDVISLFMIKLRVFHIITITNNLSSDLKRRYNFNDAQISVLADGVDLTKFNCALSKAKAREIVNYSSDKKLVLYTGNLYEWKGVYTLLEAARQLNNVNFVFVGGKAEEVEIFRERAKEFKNVVVQGYVPHNNVINFLRSADIVCLPNSAELVMSNLYTSPLKLFEYMASHVPIVASDISSIREVLTDNKNAYLVLPDDVSSLVEKIKFVLKDSNSDSVAAKAFQDVQAYTWNQRAVHITSIIHKLTKQYEKLAY
jgi:glycosyltransferase involved in cell wall biosynthesis